MTSLAAKMWIWLSAPGWSGSWPCQFGKMQIMGLMVCKKGATIIERSIVRLENETSRQLHHIIYIRWRHVRHLYLVNHIPQPRIRHFLFLHCACMKSAGRISRVKTAGAEWEIFLARVYNFTCDSGWGGKLLRNVGTGIVSTYFGKSQSSSEASEFERRSLSVE